jgi:hypothetical protein
METLLVAAKTYERKQTGEKVRTKMQMRAEKGLWNGGYVPFGFRREEQAHVMLPDEKRTALVQQLFQVYVETRSDFAVRDWLQARQIPAPNGNPVWSVGTLRDLLSRAFPSCIGSRIAWVGKPVLDVHGRGFGQGGPDEGVQVLLSAGGFSAQVALELAPQLLDGVEVG